MPPPSPILKQAHTLLAQGHRPQARALLLKHTARVPGDLPAAILLAQLHQSLNEHADAAALLERTARIHKDPHLLYLLGNSLLALKHHDKAAAAFAQSIALNPHEPLPSYGLAQTHLARADIPAALDAVRRATAAAPHHPDAWFGLCTILARLGRFDEAAAAARQGLTHAPDDVPLLQAAVYALNVLDTADDQELTDLHRRLGRAITPATPRDPSTFPNSRDPARRLKLGLVSADYRTHSCAFFLEGLIPALASSPLDLTLYSLTAEPDDVTARFKSLAPFKDLAPLPEPHAQSIIAQDAPDILLELSGWTSRAQMKLLAPRLAPLQGTYLGYPNTTGLPAMDFRLVDATTDPGTPHFSALATETLLRLPRCFLAFAPGSDWPNPLPRGGRAGEGLAVPTSQIPNPTSEMSSLTFCSFNNLTKLSPSTIRTWKALLDAVPNSRLLLKSPRLPQELLDHHKHALTTAGIPEHRLTLHPFIERIADHVALYHQADIALDPFPYNGTTTTCEALFMGVPVITLAGRSHRARVGASLLTAINHPELIAATEDDYITKAAQLASNPARLHHYHSTLRADMQRSPLLDHAGLAAAIHNALRDQWRRFCR